jgi:ubiquinone/menaquinone biosynthesis C-methylase UbiE
MAGKLVNYYNETAQTYDALHNTSTNPEHTTALESAWPLLPKNLESALDVGCGTGRTLLWLANRDPSLLLHGIEPAGGLAAIARSALPNVNIVEGVGDRMPFANGSIDLVVATGIMHHVDEPTKIISEMFRVAGKAVLISDHNNYAFGGRFSQKLSVFKALNLFSAFVYIKQGFRRQGYSKEDGWWYPYSLLENYRQIATCSRRTYIIPTRSPSGPSSNFIFAQSHFAILALKQYDG